ncbi:MAG: hypothetical protein JM58_07155 [Peptococcaceae bacterium BICA1-8]|nr:MAG: hypothetical protein JM58_07155 [Peptococcaceae bacterium BICA1-8]
MSGYILTYTKKRFFPLEPVKEDIEIKDIAHALSLMTRANGHFPHFYSVAQHSINCYKEAKSRGYSERVQLGCLLHDASESYIADVTRPVKCNLPGYIDIEEKLQNLIYDKFGLGDLSEVEKSQIENIDDTLLYYEFKELMDTEIFEIPPFKSMKQDFSQREFNDIEKEFISIFKKITNKPEQWSCIGIDGCRGGWIAVNITDTNFHIDIYKTIEDIFLKHEGFDSIIIDMPIGLPEKEKDIRPDSSARKMLPGKTSSIFNTPCRQAVYSKNYKEANEINKQVMGKGLSAQSFAICRKIKEIDEYLQIKPEYKNKLLESHPELCFAMLNFGQPLLENKKKPEGIKKRVEVLSCYYDKTEEIINYVNNDRTLKSLKDDVIDALCLAVTGKVGFEQGFKVLPENPTMDQKGLFMQIVYA